MTRRLKQPPPAETPLPDADAVLQIKVWLLDISPMVWRRLLVPSSYTLRELHGVIQVAMGWEGSSWRIPQRHRHFSRGPNSRVASKHG